MNAAPAFVFVSYAHADAEPVRRLIADLQAAGIGIWIDEQGLTVGTASWEQALRDAIREAAAVVLAATPNSRGSRYVADELRLAEMYRRVVYPIWMAGDEWMECIPIGWGSTQHLDGRGDRYERALHDLAAVIHAGQGTPAPKAVSFPSGPLLAAPRNPYKGLRAFGGADAGDFFGREALVETLLDALREAVAGKAPRFLAVVGPSGSGKSSVVLAGLLPRLRSGALPGSAAWIYLDPLLPGDHPLEALTLVLSQALPERSLAAIREDLDASPRGLHLLARSIGKPAGTPVVLVVDQSEELFTLTTDEDERRAFIDLLVIAATEPRGTLWLLLTLRADFYDRPMAYAPLGKLLEHGARSVLPMELADLRAAIERPAALPDVRLDFEADLVGDLLFDVRGQAGALPLLQFTLDQLFERREGRLLTHAAYRALGGVRGALAQHAEATYAGLAADEQRDLARALFLRLVDPGTTEQDTTRRRASMRELELPDPARNAAMRAVSDAFINARLLTAGEVTGLITIEVSHEALIREWARLAAWLRGARDDIRMQQAISADAAEWARRGRPEDRVYQGALLAEAEEWAARNTPSALERDFLAVGRLAWERQEERERARQARELALARQTAFANRQAARRLRYLVGVLIVFLLVAGALSAFAVEKAITANGSAASAATARAAALTARNQATSRELAALAVNHLGDKFDLSLLLGVEAVHVADTGEARGSLLQTLLANPHLLTFLYGHTGSITSVAFNRTGSLLASSGVDGTIRIWDVAGRRQRALMQGQQVVPVTVNSVAFSPDGKQLVSGSDDGTLQLWSVATGQPLGAPFQDQTDSVRAVVFSPDGKQLATASGDGDIRLWDVAGRSVLGAPLASGSHFATTLTYSPDGTLLAAGSQDGVVLCWDASSRVLLGQAPAGPGSAVTSVAFSPDGKTLAASSADSTIRLWHVMRGAASAPLLWTPLGTPLRGHAGAVTGVAFSPDGRTLVSSGADATLRLWDVASGKEIGAPLRGAGGAVNGVAFSVDGKTLASGGADEIIRLWSLGDARVLSATLTGPTDTVSSVAFSPDGKLLVAGSQDKSTWLWDVATRRPLGVPLPPQPMGVDSARFSPNGAILATGADDGTAQLWNRVRPGGAWTPLGVPLPNAPGTIVGLAFSPNGAILAAGGQSNVIVLWDVRSRQEIGQPLAGHTDVVTSVAFSPDGRMLASASQDKTIRLWSIPSGQPMDSPLTGHTDSVDAVAFSPDGKLLATGSADTTIRLWTVANGQPYGAPLTGHTDTVTGVAFSPDGKLLASASLDGTVRLWDVATGQEVGPPLTGHRGAVTSVAFSPDGALLASGGADHTIRLWNVGLADWTRRACAITNRDLAPREWQTYLSGLPFRRVCP